MHLFIDKLKKAHHNNASQESGKSLKKVKIFSGNKHHVSKMCIFAQNKYQLCEKFHIFDT